MENRARKREVHAMNVLVRQVQSIPLTSLEMRLKIEILFCSLN